MGFFKESVIVAFLASQAYALPAPAETTSTFACNPAHSYPAGQSCISTNGALTLVSATSAAASTTTFACNPAHSYPAGQSCISTNGALTLVSATSAAASTSTFACNPAHSYPAGQTCISTNGALSLVSSTPAASATTAATSVACNPAHSYPGVTCVSTNGALTLVSTPAASATTAATTFACNPAHSYPGVTCVSTNGGLTLVSTPAASATTAPANGGAVVSTITKTITSTITGSGDACVASSAPAPSKASASSSAPVSSTSAPPASSSGVCPLTLTSGAYEYPHLLEINGQNGYFGSVSSTDSTFLSFDIPAADAGKNCDTYFALPAKNTLVTSDYNLTTVDGASISVSAGGVGKVASFEPETDKSWLIYSEKCPAGTSVNYTMTTGDSLSLRWFQDYNACALGMFIVVS